MGYTLRIGEARVGESEPGYDYPLRVQVEEVEHPEAPAYDAYSPRLNRCYPSYTQWRRFAQEAGLEGLFYGDRERGSEYETGAGLCRPHPGCRPLLSEHLEQVRRAVERYKAGHPNARPGWDPAFDNLGRLIEGAVPDITYDADLARLLWLEWWMTWALANCACPAFENS